MARDSKHQKGQIIEGIGGIDESVSLASSEPSFASTSGVFPFFYGMHHRMFGKKIIDFNPEQEVHAIHQAFNGICLYGYYVETNNKLYFHLCDAPPDLRIRFYTP